MNLPCIRDAKQDAIVDYASCFGKAADKRAQLDRLAFDEHCVDFKQSVNPSTITACLEV